MILIRIGSALSTSYPRAQHLTCSISSYIHNFTFCSMNMMVFHHCEGHGLDINSILSPRFQSLQQNSRIVLFVWWQVDVNHVPAIGATRILPIVLCHISEWSEILKEKNYLFSSKTHDDLCLYVLNSIVNLPFTAPHCLESY